MCPFYNAQLFEITRAAKGVFTHSQSSCHIAKVVLTIRHDSRQIPLAARHHHTFPHRGFLHWRFAYAGPVCAAPPSWGRHPQTFTITVIPAFPRSGKPAPIFRYLPPCEKESCPEFEKFVGPDSVALSARRSLALPQFFQTSHGMPS